MLDGSFSPLPPDWLMKWLKYSPVSSFNMKRVLRIFIKGFTIEPRMICVSKVYQRDESVWNLRISLENFKERKCFDRMAKNANTTSYCLLQKTRYEEVSELDVLYFHYTWLKVSISHCLSIGFYPWIHIQLIT